MLKARIALAALPFLCFTPAFAGEYAIFQNGFRLHATRHEVQGDMIRLYSDAGYTDVKAQDVSGFEQEEYTPPPPAPPQIAAVPPTATPVPATPKSARELVQEAALKQGLPPAFVHSVVAAESAYQVNAKSPKGAIGLMQLMPGTAAQLQADPNDPAQNVEAGTKLLAQLLIKYKDYPDQVRYALAAYNAGEGAVAKYHGVPPYRETQEYVEKIIRNYLKQSGAKAQ